MRKLVWDNSGDPEGREDVILLVDIGSHNEVY